MSEVCEIIITIHGVESIGRWQDQIHPEFGGIDDFVHEPHNYGRFQFWKAAVPCLRRREIRRFYKKYSEIRGRNQGVAPSVVAHSFGTYIVAHALLTYPYIEFDRVILCGSVVDCDYDWVSLLEKNRIRRIRNEVAGRDYVVQLFRWRLMRLLIPGTGPSGTDNFRNTSNQLQQPFFNLFTHSEHFVANEHCRKSWIPFLRGTEHFMNLCKRCLHDGSDAVQALAEFDQEYGSLIRGYVEKLFHARFPTAEQISDYYKIVRGNVIYEGVSGKRNAEKLVQRQTLALLNVISR